MAKSQVSRAPRGGHGGGAAPRPEQRPNERVSRMHPLQTMLRGASRKVANRAVADRRAVKFQE